MNDSDPPYAAPEDLPADLPAGRNSLVQGFLSCLGAIAAGWAVMAALQYLAFGVIGEQKPLALFPALLSLTCVPIAVALLAVHYFTGRRLAAGWGALLAAAVAVVGWTFLP